MTDQPIMSPERMEQAKRYSALRYRNMLISLAVTVLYLIVLLAGAGRALWAALPQPLLFVAVLLAGDWLVGLPTGYYAHLQSRRFGLSVQGGAGWLWDEAKSFLLSLVMNGLLALLLLWLWRALPATWYLWMAAVAVLLDLLITFVAPVWIMPLFNKYTPLEEGDLRNRLMRLSQSAGVFVKGVFVSHVSEKETRLNAALTGLGATRRIILYDTMIAACTPEEVEVVLGHEMGHHVYGHIVKMTLLSSGFLAVAFLVAGVALAPVSGWLGLGGLVPAALPLVAALFGLIGLPLMPIFMAISRQWERDCDAFALKLTGNPGAFIGAFRKLADRNMADFTPPRWVYWFLYSHPLVPERIAMAEQIQAENA
jgi:STE24 endopeptidase